MSLSPVGLGEEPSPPVGIGEEPSVLQDDDLLLVILRALTPMALGHAAQVCRRWHALARADSLWVTHCAERWRGKQVPWAAVAQEPTWCARYVRAEREAETLELSTAELQRRVWLFSDNLQHCRFRVHKNGAQRLYMDYFPPLRWLWNGDGTLQVEQFPPHAVDRLPDWRWRISNEYIYMVRAGIGYRTERGARAGWRAHLAGSQCLAAARAGCHRRAQAAPPRARR